MLYEIVSMVVLAAFPVDLKLILVSSIANPIKTNVHCFGTTIDGAKGNPASGGDTKFS